MKRRTNHEGQPRPPSQPTNAGDTVGQKHTHPKIREGQQGDRTYNPMADTTATGAPRHRVQNPANPCKPVEAGEAQKKKGRVDAQPTSPGKQKDRHLVALKPQGNLQLGKLRKLQAPEEEHGTR